MHAALDDAEKCIRIVRMLRLAARRPACGQFHRAARLLLGRRIRRAFVELHDDVRAERVLDFDRALGCQEDAVTIRSEEHTSELQSLMRISYAVFCLKKKKNKKEETTS